VLKLLTVVFRRSALEGFSLKQMEFDTALWAHLLSRGGHAIALNRTMGVYRIHKGGSCSQVGAGRELNRNEFRDALILVSNEGLRSRSIEDFFLRSSRALSEDLTGDVEQAISDLRSHRMEALSVARSRQGLSIRDHLSYRMMRLFGFAGSLFLRLETKSFNLSCVGREVSLKRLCAKALRRGSADIARAGRRVTSLPLAAIRAFHEILSRS
jgi:hypothetical protein